jgi:hypothetical protein
MDNDRLIDRSRDPRYFAMIPYILFELGLSTDALALYVYMKRRAGENAGGECRTSTRRIAKELHIGLSTVVKAKKELLAVTEPMPLLSLVEVPSKRGKPSHHITVLDIWEYNNAFFGMPSSPEIAAKIYDFKNKKP